MVDDTKPIEFAKIDKKVEIGLPQTETIEKIGSGKDIKGEDYDEISKSIGDFTKNSYISEPENRKMLEKNHNLRNAFVLLLGAREPMMVGDFKNKINLSKPARYSLFHKLREMGLVKNISVMNLFMVGSPITKKGDLFKDDLKDFTEEERKIVLQKFRKWTYGMKSNKQKQNYISGTFYWSISKEGKEKEFLKWISIIENTYRSKKKEDIQNEEE